MVRLRVKNGMELFYDLEVWVKYNYRKLGRERMYGQQDKPTILLVFTRNKTRVN